MGRPIKLTFSVKEELDKLLMDSEFMMHIEYFNPRRLNDHNIALIDPSEYHNSLLTELVVLTEFAWAIKKVLYPESTIEFIEPEIGKSKIGLKIKGIGRIIESTDTRLANIIVKTSTDN